MEELAKLLLKEEGLSHLIETEVPSMMIKFHEILKKELAEDQSKAIIAHFAFDYWSSTLKPMPRPNRADILNFVESVQLRKLRHRLQEK